MQAEDELASINMALGASYGGVPSLTATSGPGLSLMIESLGLGVAAEVPVVVVDVMRTGPSTGIATKSEQADLNIALYGLHGDAPHVVVAPNSVADCVAATEWAVGLAESLQVPAIVLSDQYFGQARAVVDIPAFQSKAFERVNGEKRRTLQALRHHRVGRLADGDSRHAGHDLHRRRPRAQRERHALLAGARPSGPDGQARSQDLSPRPGGCLGEHRGGRRDRCHHLRLLHRPGTRGFARNNSEIRLVSLRLLSPAQPERLKKALEGVKRVLVVEQNHSGQFLRYLRGEYDLPGEVRSLRRPGPLPFRPDEILKAL